MKNVFKIFLFVLIGVAAIQFYRPKEIKYNAPQKDLTNVPKDVTAILRNSCFACHSNETRLSWYDKITPINFVVNSHIKKGRKVLNFSNWDSLEKPKQNAVLFYAFNKILSGEMPLQGYQAVHVSARLDDASKLILKNYITSLAPRNAGHGTSTTIMAPEKKTLSTEKTTSKVLPSPNGIQYIPEYRGWKAVSTSDRFDNGSMRIIFGNDAAIKAIKEHQTNPWPDGVIFAKTAWKQKTAADGTSTAGAFIQVEYMIKDSKKYADTKGWGWARWKGNDLKPYGEDVHFDQECISCHNPVRHNDYVFTTPLHLDINKYNVYNK
ncbi:MAG: cytochrome P460 family protein [Flavobacterium sp.]